MADQSHNRIEQTALASLRIQRSCSECAPNPIVRGTYPTLSARVSDALTGGGTVEAAEWSYGDAPNSAGLGGAMSGAFGTQTVEVSAAIGTGSFLPCTRKLWVRARDAAGNWGPWSSLTLQVNSTEIVAVPEPPAISFLAQNAPNPFGAGTTIRFGLARAGEAALEIFDTQGRRVRRLVRATLPAGLYVCRLVLPGGGFERRLVRL